MLESSLKSDPDGLAKSLPLVAEATKAEKSLRSILTNVTVSAMDVVSKFECIFQGAH